MYSGREKAYGRRNGTRPHNKVYREMSEETFYIYIYSSRNRVLTRLNSSKCAHTRIENTISSKNLTFNAKLHKTLKHCNNFLKLIDETNIPYYVDVYVKYYAYSFRIQESPKNTPNTNEKFLSGLKVGQKN